MKILNWLKPTHHRRGAPVLRAIFIADSAGRAMQSIATVQAIAGAGLQGDRYAEARGFWQVTEACQLTLISEDDLSHAKHRAAANLQEKLDNGDHRRNLVLAGVRTKALQGRTFRIGQAVFRYHKPRPPCGYLDKIEAQGMSKALGKHSGICLIVIESGKISVGDVVEFVETNTRN